jgi:lysophospholipase L1-like esterase/acetyl esterase/lipase
MFLRLFIFLILFSTFYSRSFSQNSIPWDDTKSKDWPSQVKKVDIKSSADGILQAAIFYAAPGPGPKPLIISLHTWSGDYMQKDTIANICIARGFNYIHPDFRGPNRRPEACASELVISDIDDAISWAMANTQTDPENIHVIGVSGGGYATVLTYLRSKHKIRSFSAYAGLYNLVDWYDECVGRKARYVADIEASTSGKKGEFNLEEAKKRSPFFMGKPVTDRSNSKLTFYCGIHDGYTGSVPITHSLQMYNKLVGDFDPHAPSSLVPQEYILTMVRARSLPGGGDQGTFRGRKIIYKNDYQKRINITVFEGTHEMPPGDILEHVPSHNILAIGDSNGALEYGWVNQLEAMRTDQIINTCIGGNTIGFDNLDKEELNTLKNVDKIFQKAGSKTDAIVVMLGTNDCKTVYANQTREVVLNLDKLIKQLKERSLDKNGKSAPIFIVSPPPYGDDEMLKDKYKGAAKRVEYLVGEFRKTAEKNKCHFIDTHTKLKAAFPYLTEDGVHLTREGQHIIASAINEEISKMWTQGR